MTFSEYQLHDVLDIQWGDTSKTKASYVLNGFMAFSAKGPDGYLDKYDYDCDGIVLSAIGANCGATFFASGKWSCIKNTIRILPKSNLLDLKYFYYMSKLPDFWPIRGSAQPFISQTDIREMYIQIPKVNVQKIVGDTLFNIEQKIAINEQISKILEDIAQTIFKSWFIDFDPVKAKMNGEKPIGMDDETAALFPDSFEESELGLIPKGWEVTSLEKHVTVTKGKSYKSSELEASNTALVTLKSFLRGGGYRFDGLKPFSGEYKQEQIIEPGELIVSFTDVTQAADVIGKPALVLRNPKYTTLVASLDVGIVRPSNNSIGKSFLYQLFSSPIFKNHVEGYTNGTTVLHLGKGAIEDFRLALPNEKLITKFEIIGTLILEQIQILYQQNLTLNSIRDSLLPRLISGELQIPEEMLAS